MINSINYSRNNITFEGLKENLDLGRQVMRGFRSEYPLIKSNTYVAAKIIQHENKGIHIIEDLWELAFNYNQKIKIAREELQAKLYFNLDSFIQNLKNILKKSKCENCETQADIIQYELLQRQQKPHKVFINIKSEVPEDARKRRYHIFTVFGMKKGALPENPKTWGNNAVVVDPWANIVMPAREAIEYFKSFFKFDSKCHSLEFGTRDRILVE